MEGHKKDGGYVAIRQQIYVVQTPDGKAHYEWLNMHIFDSIGHAQSLATQWMCVYNNERPHSSIGGIPPRKLLEAI
jgi:transposase InsO family protein